MEIVSTELKHSERFYDIKINAILRDGIHELCYSVVVIGVKADIVSEYYKLHQIRLTTSEKRQIRELIHKTFNKV